MRHFLPAIILLCAASLPVRAVSQQGSGGGFSGSGSFVATQNLDGSYTIDSLTGDPGSGVGSLIAPRGFNGNDNLLFPGNSSVADASGFSFTDLQGDTAFQVNIFATDANGDYSAFLYDSDGLASTIPVTFSLGDGSNRYAAFASAFSLDGPGTVTDFSFAIAAVQPTATPEPSSLLLLGTGLLAIGGFVRSRYRTV